jgi:hypothetical protein
MSCLKAIVEALDELKINQIDLDSDAEVPRKDALSYLLPTLKQLKAVA